MLVWRMSKLLVALCLVLSIAAGLFPWRAGASDWPAGMRVVEEVWLDGSSFTASATVAIEGKAGDVEAIWLGSSEQGEGQLGLLWKKDPNDWFERWAVWLVDGSSDPTGRGPLGHLTPSPGRSYDLKLAYDAESGAVALRLLDLTGGAHVSGTDHAGPGRELARVGIALAGEQGVSVAKVTALTVEHHFVPVGMSFRLLQREGPADKFAAFTVVDRQRESAVELAVPWGFLPGAGRLVMVSSGAEKVQIEISELADGVLVPVDTSGWPAGQVSLRLDYVREGEAVSVDEKEFRVGAVKVAVEDLAPVVTEGKTTTWQGVLRLEADGAVGDVHLRLDVRRTDYGPHLPNGSEVSRVTVLATDLQFADAATHRLPFRYTMETPDHPWGLTLEPSVEPVGMVQGYAPPGMQELYYGKLAEEAEPASQDRIRIALYNVRHGRGMDDQVDIRRVADVLRAYDVDLVAFNELDYGWPRSNKVDQPRVLSELLGLPYFYFMPTVQQFSPSLQGHGHAVVTRLPMVKALGKYLPRIGDREFRGAIGAEIPLADGKTLHVWVTHLAHGGSSADVELRRLQAEALIKLAEGSELALIMGDMNALPAEPAVQAFLAAGWVDVWTKRGEGPGWTFPSDYPASRIDYIFATPALAEAFVSIEVPRTLASDHRPVIAEIDLTRLP